MEEIKIEDNNEKGDKLTPEQLLRQKEDYVTCTIQAASLLLKTKHDVEIFLTRFKERFLKIKKEQLENEGQKDDPKEYISHADKIELLGATNLLTINSDVVKPNLGLVGRGLVDFFIPTDEVTQTVTLIQFYLSHKTSVLLMGEKGCGKSLAFSKVVKSLPKETSIKYLNMTSMTTIDFNYEVSLLQGIRDPSQCLVGKLRLNIFKIYLIASANS